MNLIDKSLLDISYSKDHHERNILSHQHIKLLPDCIKYLNCDFISLYISNTYEPYTGPSCIYITLHKTGEHSADIVQWSKQTMKLLSDELGVVWDDKPSAYNSTELSYTGSTTSYQPSLHITISKVPLSSHSCTILKREEKTERIETSYEIYCPEEVAI